MIDLNIEALERRKRQLSEEIARQQRLLEQLRGRVAFAQRDRQASAMADFDSQVEQLSSWSRESRAGLLRRLRARAEAGEDVGDLRVLCRESRIER